METRVESLAGDTTTSASVSYTDDTPSPPILAIRLVSPPTPTSPSPDPFKAGIPPELSCPTLESSDRYHSLSHSTRSLQDSRYDSQPPSLLQVDRSTDRTSSLPRSTTPTTFSFSTLFSSTTTSRSLSTSLPTQQQPTSFAQPSSSKMKQTYKVRSPLLGQSKRTNVGMVKQAALGLARKVSRTVQTRISLSSVNGKNERSTTETQKHQLRRIDEGEFPNVGVLSEARRLRNRLAEEEQGKKKTRRRSSNVSRQERETPLKARSRQSFGAGQSLPFFSHHTFTS